MYTSHYLPMHYQARNPLSGLPIWNQTSQLMLWCYTLFKVPYFPQDCRERVLQAPILTESNLNYLKRQETLWEPRDPPSWYI